MSQVAWKPATMGRRCGGIGLGVLLLVLLVVPAGCGASAGDDEALWDELEGVKNYVEPHLRAMVRGDLAPFPPEMAQGAHESATGLLGAALEEHPEGSEPLREMMEALIEGHQQLAEGEVAGSEADELRERLLEYWSHVSERELPPQFR